MTAIPEVLGPKFVQVMAREPGASVGGACRAEALWGLPQGEPDMHASEPRALSLGAQELTDKEPMLYASPSAVEGGSH